MIKFTPNSIIYSKNTLNGSDDPKNRKKSIPLYCIVLCLCVGIIDAYITIIFHRFFFVNDGVEWRGNRLKYKKTRKLLSIEPNNVKYFIF